MTSLGVDGNGGAGGNGHPSQRLPTILAVCIWLLTFTCFTLPGRTGPQEADAMDPIALMKLATRFGVVVLLIAMLATSWRVPHRRSVVACLTPLGLFVGWSVVSTLWSPLKSISTGQAFGLTALFLLAVNAGLCGDCERGMSQLLRTIETALLALSGIVVATNQLFPAVGSLDRLNPGILHPTAAAATASLGLLLLVACRQLWGWKWTRVQLWPGIAVYVCLLVLAANRTTLFLSLALLAILTVACGGRRGLSVLLLVASLAIIAYLVVDPGWEVSTSTSTVLFERVNRGEVRSLESFSGRTEMWEAVWNSYLQSPWIGHGYFVTSSRGEFLMWGLWSNWTAHNIALQALATTGAIGAVLLACGLALPWFRAVAGHSVSDFHRKAAGLLLLLGAWFLVWGLFNESWLGPLEPESVVFFCTLGGAAALASRRVPQADGRRSWAAAGGAMAYSVAGLTPGAL